MTLISGLEKKNMAAKKLIQLGYPILVAMDEVICPATAEFAD